MIGTSVSHYRVTAKLAEGGMGEVYVGFDEALARRVALKAIRKERRLSAEARSRFLREARVLSHLDHPHICRVFDYVAGEDLDFIVLELVEGRSLREALSAEAPPSEPLRVAEELLEVLVAAHASGIVHRDLKPENVMLDTAGCVKVLDFGLARVADTPGPRPASTAAPSPAAAPPDLVEAETLDGPTEARAPLAADPRMGGSLTAYGAITGTLAYMSPEQARGETATTASDLYSLGIVLQELFTGRRAYPPELRGPDLLRSVAGGETLPVTGVSRDLTALLERLKALARLRWIRDAPKRRLRRLAAAAVLAAVALGTLKYTLDLRRERALAVAAREEAERRRGQAEDLVQFMLGDLRARLEPVGRLDALDGVAAKALDYFASIEDHELSEADRFRRARALTQIGEVRIAQGDLAAADRSLREAHALARDLVDRQPQSGERLMGLGAIEFWIGNVHWLQGDLAAAEARFQSYLDVAQRLVRLDGANPEWRLELSHAHSNLGTVQEARGNIEAALEHFRLTVETRRELVRSDPGASHWQKDLADSLSWLGEALLAAGDLAAARDQYQAGQEVLESLLAAEPENTQYLYVLGIAHNKIGSTLESLGSLDEALRHFEQSLAIHRRLEELDPANADWRREVAVDHQRLGLATVPREPALALRHLKLGARALARLLRDDVSNDERRLDLVRAHRDVGRGLLASDEAEKAVDEERKALAVLPPATPAEADERRRRILQAEILVVLGEALSATAQPAEARAAWEQAASALMPLAARSRDPRLLAPLAHALLRLGRRDDARVPVEQLRASGYRRWDLDRILSQQPSG
jgi:serine/threonine-protein kinase